MSGEAAAALTGAGAGNGAGGTAPTGNQGSAGTPAPAAGGDWRTGLSDEHRGYVENKGWRDASGIVESYRNLESLTGVPADQLIRIPKPEDAQGWANVWGRLGRPDKPEGYELPAPEGADAELTKDAAGWFHEAGVPKGAAQKVIAKLHERALAAEKAKTEATAAKVAEDNEGLKKAWGLAFDQNINAAKKAVAEFGLAPDLINQIQATVGYKGVLEFLSSVGSRFAEDTFVGDDSGTKGSFGGAMTPAQAMDRIRTLEGDHDFGRRLTSGDANALSEWNNLLKHAYPSNG